MKTLTITWLLDSPENFAFLLRKLILWPERDKNYEKSGYVTAALFNFEGSNEHLIAIHRPNLQPPQWWTSYHWDRDGLIDFFSGNPEIVGDSEEDTYLLVK